MFRDPDFRQLRRRGQRADLRFGQDGLGRDRVAVGAAQDAGDVIAVFVRDDDQVGRRQRGLNPVVTLRPVGLVAAESVEAVYGLVHARVDHQAAVGVDDLKGGSRRNKRFVRSAIDDRRKGAMALGKLDEVYGLRRRPGHIVRSLANAFQEILGVAGYLAVDGYGEGGRQHGRAQNLQHICGRARRGYWH